MTLEIYICRHGETTWTQSGQHTGRTDIGLTDGGKQQALKLKQKLAPLAFSKVFSSPLIRAKETAILAGFHPLLTPDALEWNYGDYEGLDHQQIMQRNPSWSLFDQGAPGGETPQQIGKRADHLIEFCLQEKGQIALFSHGHFLRVFTARWLGLPPSQGKLFLLSVASVGILSFERTQRVIARWNDTSHLQTK